MDNDCLDSGNTIELEIEISSNTTSIAVAEDCDAAEVEVFDDDGKEKQSMHSRLLLYTG